MANKKKKYNARFPPARIKKIMQKDDNVGKVAVTVPLIISRSLELFIEKLITKSYNITISKKAKTLSIHHLKQVIHADNNCKFLEEILSKIPDFENTEIETPTVGTLNKEEASVLNSFQTMAKTNSTNLSIGYEGFKTSKDNSKNQSVTISKMLKEDYHKKDNLYNGLITQVQDSKMNNGISIDNTNKKEPSSFNINHNSNLNNKGNNTSNFQSLMDVNNEQNVEKNNTKMNNLALSHNEQLAVHLPANCDSHHQSDNEALDLTYSSKKIRRKPNSKERLDKKNIITNACQTSEITSVPYSTIMPSYTSFLNDLNEANISPNANLLTNAAPINSNQSHLISQHGKKTQLNICENFQSPFFTNDYNLFANVSQNNISEFEKANMSLHNSVLQGLNISAGVNLPYIPGLTPFFSNPMIPIQNSHYPQAQQLIHHSAMQLNSDHINNKYMDINLNRVSDKPSKVIKSKKK